MGISVPTLPPVVFEMIKILVQHAARVFDTLPADPAPQATNNPKLALLQALPAQFDQTKYIEVAAQLQIPESTADKHTATNYVKKVEQ